MEPKNGEGEIQFGNGNVNENIDIVKQSLTIAEKTHNFIEIAKNYNSLGKIYYRKGKIKEAKQMFEKSLLHSTTQKKESLLCRAVSFDTLFTIALENDDRILINEYLDRLSQLTFANSKNKEILLYYEVNLEIYNKEYGRLSERAGAEEFFKDIIKNASLSLVLMERCILHLTDILLMEYKLTQNQEAEVELLQILNDLEMSSFEGHSEWFRIQIQVLQAQYSLVNLETRKTRLILKMAQDSAEKYGLTNLAQKISKQRDKLLSDWDIWTRYQKDQVPLKK